MTLGPNQPKSGHLSSRSANPKPQSGSSANPQMPKGRGTRSTNYPKAASRNSTARGSDSPQLQGRRGYVRNDQKSRIPTRKVGGVKRIGGKN